MGLPTPPSSSEVGSNDAAEEISPVSMSTTFYLRDDLPSDLILVSWDGVFFTVFRQMLLSKSDNYFAGLLLQEECLSFTVTENASIFNLILHAFYNLDPEKYKPTLDQIAEMLDCLAKYGMSVRSLLVVGSPFSYLILSHARLQPLETYSLVCRHGIEELAVDVSRHLLSVPLYNLTDTQCTMMGPVYLRRLMFLQLGRMERLKILLKELPASHPPRLTCDELDQKRLLLARWRAAAADICWELSAGLSVSVLQTTFTRITESLPCAECQTLIKERIRKLVVDWSTVKNTI